MGTLINHPRRPVSNLSFTPHGLCSGAVRCLPSDVLLGLNFTTECHKHFTLAYTRVSRYMTAALQRDQRKVATLIRIIELQSSATRQAPWHSTSLQGVFCLFPQGETAALHPRRRYRRFAVDALSAAIQSICLPMYVLQCGGCSGTSAHFPSDSTVFSHRCHWKRLNRQGDNTIALDAMWAAGIVCIGAAPQHTNLASCG